MWSSSCRFLFRPYLEERKEKRLPLTFSSQEIPCIKHLENYFWGKNKTILLAIGAERFYGREGSEV
jgi:hypothetical protein